MDRKDLDKILQDHKRWLQRSDGWSAEDRAHLTAEDLYGMDLRGVELPRANLFAADLREANLQDAILYEANLRGADLYGANLRGAILWGAVLWEADLRHADFSGADLRGAVLLRADLRYANLFGADLRGADFETALTNGMKTDTHTKIDWPMVCPETGAFIAWKNAFEYDGRIEKRKMIVKLKIPEDALRSSATTNKCRASWAKVLEIQNEDGTKADATEAESNWGSIYKVGEMVYPDDWDYNRWNECTHGIHFFMTREEAIAW